jgi:hypothetical protein
VPIVVSGELASAVGSDRVLGKAKQLVQMAETRAASLKDGSYGR